MARIMCDPRRFWVCLGAVLVLAALMAPAALSLGGCHQDDRNGLTGETDGWAIRPLEGGGIFTASSLLNWGFEWLGDLGGWLAVASVPVGPEVFPGPGDGWGKTEQDGDGESNN